MFRTCWQQRSQNSSFADGDIVDTVCFVKISDTVFILPFLVFSLQDEKVQVVGFSSSVFMFYKHLNGTDSLEV